MIGNRSNVEESSHATFSKQSAWSISTCELRACCWKYWFPVQYLVIYIEIGMQGQLEEDKKCPKVSGLLHLLVLTKIILKHSTVLPDIMLDGFICMWNCTLHHKIWDNFEDYRVTLNTQTWHLFEGFPKLEDWESYQNSNMMWYTLCQIVSNSV